MDGKSILWHEDETVMISNNRVISLPISKMKTIMSHTQTM